MTCTRRDALKSLGVAVAAAAVIPKELFGSPGRFTFARLRYQSGDWDTDPKMPANLLNSMVEYTRTPVDPREQIIALDSADLSAYPFVYMSGHELVRFTKKEKENFGRYVEDGGFARSRNQLSAVAGPNPDRMDRDAVAARRSCGRNRVDAAVIDAVGHQHDRPRAVGR